MAFGAVFGKASCASRTRPIMGRRSSRLTRQPALWLTWVSRRWSLMFDGGSHRFPDVEVCLHDGNSIFIEQTIVMDPDAHRLSIAIEETNISVTQAAATDGGLRDILDVGLFTIRLDHKTERHLTLTLPVRALSAEVCSVGRQLEGDVSWRRPKPKDYPLLAELSARIFYRPVIRTGAVIQPPMDHGRLPVLPPTLREWLRSKLGKAGTYAAECRPL